jgi:hypothetical protein
MFGKLIEGANTVHRSFTHSFLYTHASSSNAFIHISFIFILNVPCSKNNKLAITLNIQNVGASQT